MPQVEEGNIDALIFVEGDTEEEFYKLLLPCYLNSFRRRLFNLKGNFNIHGKILDKASSYISGHSSTQVRIYCFVDRESINGLPPLYVSRLKALIKKDPIITEKVLSVDRVLATQMFESWLFYEIEGIYRFLRTKRSKRKPNKYRNTKNFNCHDLSKLFKECGDGKEYIKGSRSRNFIEHLDLEKIYDKCDELRKGIEKMNKDFR